MNKKKNQDIGPIIRWRKDFEPLPQTPPPDNPEQGGMVPIIPVVKRRKGIFLKKRFVRDDDKPDTLVP